MQRILPRVFANANLISGKRCSQKRIPIPHANSAILRRVRLFFRGILYMIDRLM